MKKYITLIAYVVFILFRNTAAAQDELIKAEAKDTKRDARTFNIVSLDGKCKKVKVTPDYVKRVLRISCLKDTINIYNYWGVPAEIQVLNRNFIEIKYEVRGGSNLGLGNDLILCVNGNRLYESMHVLRYSSWDSGDIKTNYHIKLILKEDGKSKYRLNVNIHDDAYSKRNPEENYNYNNQTVLSFDNRRNAFYNVKENVYDHVVTTKGGTNAKQKVDGNFPVIILGKETYYFINDSWYQLVSGAEMNEFE